MFSIVKAPRSHMIDLVGSSTEMSPSLEESGPRGVGSQSKATEYLLSPLSLRVGGAQSIDLKAESPTRRAGQGFPALSHHKARVPTFFLHPFNSFLPSSGLAHSLKRSTHPSPRHTDLRFGTVTGNDPGGVSAKTQVFDRVTYRRFTGKTGLYFVTVMANIFKPQTESYQVRTLGRNRLPPAFARGETYKRSR